MGKLSLGCLNNAKEDDVGADCHKRYVKVRRVDVLSWRLIPMAPADLQAGNSDLSVKFRSQPRWCIAD